MTVRGRERNGVGQRDLDAVARDDMASGAYHLELGVGFDVSFKEWFRRASSSSGQTVVGRTWQGRRGVSSISCIGESAVMAYERKLPNNSARHKITEDYCTLLGF